MAKQVFTASQQMAIDWVLRTLIFESEPGNWEKPRWANFTWFTSIVTTRERPLKDNARNRADVAYFGRRWESFVEKDVIFFLAKEEVVRVTLRGFRSIVCGTPSTSWTISRVSYRLTWRMGTVEEWCHYDFMAVSFTGRSPEVAPEG